jgi:hypothetical protein
MVEEINGANNSTNSESIDPNRKGIHIHGRMSTTWSGMPNITLMEEHKS